MQIEHNPLKVEDTGNLGNIMITPAIGPDYWSMRVPLTDKQAVVCFPKFGTIGIGFQRENDDWNTNLPYTMPAEEIYNYIACNKGDDTITAADCIAAIRMLQDAITKQKETAQ